LIFGLNRRGFSQTREELFCKRFGRIDRSWPIRFAADGNGTARTTRLAGMVNSESFCKFKPDTTLIT
jgi:hypothetical protein